VLPFGRASVVLDDVAVQIRREPALPSGRSFRTSPALWYAVAMSPVVAAYFAVPSWNPVLWLVIGLSSCVATVAGVRLNNPPRRLPWYLIAAATFTLINGDTIYNILTDFLHQNEPFPSAADVSYLFTYPLAAAGIMLMIRARSPHRDGVALVDALLLAGGAALLVWVFVITPTVHQPSVAWFDSAVAIAYPIGDLFLLAVILRLLAGGGVRGWSPALLVVGALGLMGSDIAYALVRLYGTWRVGTAADLGWILFYICWGATALDPSMVEVTEPHTRDTVLTAGRVIPLALTALIAPAILLTEVLRRDFQDAALLCAISALMFVLVVIRLSLQGRQQRYQQSVAASRAMVQELHERAYSDALTGLGNRARFQEHSESSFTRAQESGGEVCMLLIDLDNFKEVNDTLGHRAGDELLKTAAQRLSAAVRPGDLPVRFGGDEFAVLLADGSRSPAAQALAERLIRTFSEPFRIWDVRAEVRASIGVASSSDSPDTAAKDAADVLLRNADLALYAAKADGKATWKRYRPQMFQAAVERMQLRTSLSQAIAREEFFLCYQPIMDLRGPGPERVAGFEALVRWRHPTLGMLAPDQFITLAEDTGQIVALGTWVLGRAIADAARWNTGRAAADRRRVSVNVSAHQFLEESLVEVVGRCLEETGLPAEQLILEITETAFLHHHGPEVQKNLHALSRIGVRLAVDDFGTGYSSIAYLRDLSVDILKADRSFVNHIAHDPSHLRLLQGIVTVAAALDIHVVAEGVETAAQLDLLRAMGCSYVQGFYYSRAVPFEQVAALSTRLESRVQ
jgi:diguanylate cyclase (GGDEF)-like protein